MSSGQSAVQVGLSVSSWHSTSVSLSSHPSNKKKKKKSFLYLFSLFFFSFPHLLFMFIFKGFLFRWRSIWLFVVSSGSDTNNGSDDGHKILILTFRLLHAIRFIFSASFILFFFYFIDIIFCFNFKGVCRLPSTVYALYNWTRSFYFAFYIFIFFQNGEQKNYIIFFFSQTVGSNLSRIFLFSFFKNNFCLFKRFKVSTTIFFSFFFF